MWQGKLGGRDEGELVGRCMLELLGVGLEGEVEGLREEAEVEGRAEGRGQGRSVGLP